MSKINDKTDMNAFRDEARIDLLRALEFAKATGDGVLVYLLRMAVEQLSDDGPQPQKPHLEAVSQ